MRVVFLWLFLTETLRCQSDTYPFYKGIEMHRVAVFICLSPVQLPQLLGLSSEPEHEAG